MNHSKFRADIPHIFKRLPCHGGDAALLRVSNLLTFRTYI